MPKFYTTEAPIPLLSQWIEHQSEDAQRAQQGRIPKTRTDIVYFTRRYHNTYRILRGYIATRFYAHPAGFASFSRYQKAILPLMGVLRTIPRKTSDGRP